MAIARQIGLSQLISQMIRSWTWIRPSLFPSPKQPIIMNIKSIFIPYRPCSHIGIACPQRSPWFCLWQRMLGRRSRQTPNPSLAKAKKRIHVAAWWCDSELSWRATWWRITTLTTVATAVWPACGWRRCVDVYGPVGADQCVNHQVNPWSGLISKL